MERTSSSAETNMTIIFYSYGESFYGGVPFLTRLPGKNITMKQFKSCLAIKGNFRCVFPNIKVPLQETPRRLGNSDKPNSGCDWDEQMATWYTVLNPGVLTETKVELINNLVAFRDWYDSPSEEDLDKVTPFTLGDSEEDGSKRIQHIVEMTLLTLNLIAKQSRRFPGFDDLCLEDQTRLLKEYAGDLIMLRLASKYDKETDSIVFANKPYSTESFRMASMGHFGDSIFSFCRSIEPMGFTNAEYALIAAIVLFSDTSGLFERTEVLDIQWFYFDLLQSFTAVYRPVEEPWDLQKLRLKLRILGDMNFQDIYRLEINNLSPLLEKFF